MATQTISILSSAVSSQYKKDLPVLINGAADLIPYMSKGTVMSYKGEDYLYIPWQFQYNEGSKWTVEYDGSNGTYPTPLNPAYYKWRLSFKKMLGKFQLSDEMVDIQKGEHNFVEVYSKAIADMIEVFRLDLNAALHGSGTGALATGVSVSTDDPSSGYDTVTVDTTKYLREGMVLDGYDASENHDADGIVIGSITGDTTFVTDSNGGADSVDSATVFYKEGTWVSTLNYAANGIANIIDDDTGTFQNLSRSTYPQTKAHITDGTTPGTNEALTLPRVRGVLDKIAKGRNGKIDNGTIAYGTFGVVNAFRDLLATENQPTQIIAMKGGDAQVPVWQYGSIQIPMMSSSKALDDTMFFISPKRMLKYFGKQRWNLHDGGLLKALEAGPALWGALSLWVNFGTDNPQAHGRLNDITET